MDFLSKQFTFDDTVIYLLQYGDFDPSDYLDHLTEEETVRYLSFKHLKRQREFIATRILRHNIFGFKHIHYNAVGAPYIEGEGFISISHALNIVGIALNQKFQTGLDLELIQDKAHRLKSKFLNESEMAALDTEDHVEMTKCWSAKETLYKLAGRKQIDFRKDLHLEKHGLVEWKGKILNPGTMSALANDGISGLANGGMGELTVPLAPEVIEVELHVFEYGEYIVSFNCAAKNSRFLG